MSRAVFFEKIEIDANPLEIYRAIHSSGPGVLLESARVAEGQGRYSLAGSEPTLIFRYQDGITTVQPREKKPKIVSGKPLLILKKLLRQNRVSFSGPRPPFAGGAVGFAGYEAKKIFEPSLSQQALDDLNLPWMYFIFLEEGVLIDHRTREKFLFCVGKSAKAAEHRMILLKKKLVTRLKKQNLKKSRPARAASRVTSSVTRQDFILMVENAKQFIRRGDIFQANLSQRLSFPLAESVESVYARLKKVNPSSFFGILDAVDFQILSGSPERLLKLEGRQLETRPIAGTRPRSVAAKQDQASSIELLLNEKERAEHIMLVDLERNDLGRVADYGSVRVDELMALENYSHVKHIVSSVRAVLRKGFDALDAFSAFFPGGTITGAPKIRAMEIIDSLEPVARGPYTGSLGYFSFTGDMDFNIIIRSLVIQNGRAYLQVGAGIVADSDPGKEYDETLYKAEAVLTAIFGRRRTRALIRQLRNS